MRIYRCEAGNFLLHVKNCSRFFEVIRARTAGLLADQNDYQKLDLKMELLF